MMKQALKIVGYVLVAVYFAADLVFETVAVPISRWIGGLPILQPLNAWIAGFNSLLNLGDST